jgi:energy-coupling factor transporter ATP-binding protein EcfA2
MEGGRIHSRGQTDKGGLNPDQHQAALKMGLSVPGQDAPVPAAAQPVGPVILDPGTLQHRYWGAERDALVATEFALHAGERVALLGPNGAGKSTLLGLLTGQLGPEQPGVVGVPQDPDLCLFCSTVEEEVASGPVDQRVADAQKRTHAAMQALSVAALAARAPHALSRGQRLRVAVAAALSCAPKVLVLDEPTSGQDHEQVEQMMQALRSALQDGALVFATHDVDLALRHATRVLLLDQGAVLAQGSPAELAERLLAMKGGA